MLKKEREGEGAAVSEREQVENVLSTHLSPQTFSLLLRGKLLAKEEKRRSARDEESKRRESNSSSRLLLRWTSFDLRTEHSVGIPEVIDPVM